MPADVKSATPPLVFDVGMNVGDNIPYYVKKGYRVVGIDANPQLVEHVATRFASEIETGDVIVVNAGVGPTDASLPFYINTRQSVLSSFSPPSQHADDWSVTEVPVRPLSSVIREHGEPSFVKVDVEGFDAVVLRDLLKHDIVPAYLSVEVHGLEAACALVTMGYSEFQLVNCAKVGAGSLEQPVRTVGGAVVRHVFPNHSAGPFADDLPDEWVPATEMIVRWLGKRVFLGHGWYDLHARGPTEGDLAATAVSEDVRMSEVARVTGRSLMRVGAQKLSEPLRKLGR